MTRPVFEILFIILLSFNCINADVNQNETKKLKHKNHLHHHTTKDDYNVIGAHAQVLMNPYPFYPNIRSTTQSPLMNGNKQLSANFRQAPRVSLPDNWDRNPFLFQTYK